MTVRMGGSGAAPTRALRGPERVAALLLAMGKPVAEKLLPHFEAAELKRISRSAAGLGPVPADQMESLIEDFAGEFSVGLNLLGSAREIQNLMSGVIPPEQLAEMMADAPAPAVETTSDDTVWERIAALSEEILVEYLEQEHPQTVALVLSKLDPTAAAKVMGKLSQPVRDTAMRRILSIQQPTDRALRLVAGALSEDLLEGAKQGTDADKHARLAKIINKMSRPDVESTLQALAAAQPETAAALKSLLFSFEDLPRLTPAARTALMEKVPTERLVVALQGAEPELVELALSAMTSRARRMIENELKTGGAAKQRDILEARREVADIALEMAGRGEIRLDGSDDEEDEG